MKQKKHNITKAKLSKKDYYRIQVQLKEQDKMLIAIIYNIIADRDKSAAGKIRDEWSEDIKHNIIRHTETLFGTVGFARHVANWIEKHVVGAEAKNEATLYIRNTFNVTLPPPNETLL